MNNKIRPGAIMIMAGGAFLAIASLLDWTEFGDKTEIFGFQWVFTLLIGAGAAIAVAVTTFGSVELPSNVLGFTINQLITALGVAAFLILFGSQFGEAREIGVLIGWISAGVLTAGGIMESQQDAGPAAPPTTF
jgi:xanthine/uracil permease